MEYKRVRAWTPWQTSPYKTLLSTLPPLPPLPPPAMPSGKEITLRLARYGPYYLYMVHLKIAISVPLLSIFVIIFLVAFFSNCKSYGRPDCQPPQSRSDKRGTVAMGCWLLRLAINVLTFLRSPISCDLTDRLVSNWRHQRAVKIVVLKLTKILIFKVQSQMTPKQNIAVKQEIQLYPVFSIPRLLEPWVFS